jgi:hypothetical protein
MKDFLANLMLRSLRAHRWLSLESARPCFLLVSDKKQGLALFKSRIEMNHYETKKSDIHNLKLSLQ